MVSIMRKTFLKVLRSESWWSVNKLWKECPFRSKNLDPSGLPYSNKRSGPTKARLAQSVERETLKQYHLHILERRG